MLCVRQYLASTVQYWSAPVLLHLTVEPFTARDGARYWRRITIIAYPTDIRRPRYTRRIPP